MLNFKMGALCLCYNIHNVPNNVIIRSHVPKCLHSTFYIKKLPLWKSVNKELLHKLKSLLLQIQGKHMSVWKSCGNPTSIHELHMVNLWFLRLPLTRRNATIQSKEAPTRQWTNHINMRLTFSKKYPASPTYIVVFPVWVTNMSVFN